MHIRHMLHISKEFIRSLICNSLVVFGLLGCGASLDGPKGNRDGTELSPERRAVRTAIEAGLKKHFLDNQTIMSKLPRDSQELTDELIRGLEIANNSQMVIDICTCLGKVKTNPVDLLSERLDREADPWRRTKYIRGLAAVGGVSVIPKLLGELKDTRTAPSPRRFDDTMMEMGYDPLTVRDRAFMAINGILINKCDVRIDWSKVSGPGDEYSKMEEFWKLNGTELLQKEKLDK